MNQRMPLLGLVILIAICTLVAIGPAEATPTKAGGEVLSENPEGTLYRCGPEYEDICWDDLQNGVTKVYLGGE